MTNTFDNQILRSNDFYDKVNTDIDRGFHFIPFIGSGVSSRSGIMMGKDFADYLAFVLVRCVETESKQRYVFRAPESSTHYRQIDLSQDGWPEKPLPNEVKAVENWVAKNYIRLKKKYSPNPNVNEDKSLSASLLKLEFVNSLYVPLCPQILYFKEDEYTHSQDEYVKKLFTVFNDKYGAFSLPRTDTVLPDSYEAVVEAGIRSLHDWRATLSFLARLKVIRNVNWPEQYRYLDLPNQVVIDSFNEQLVWNKKPNLSHFMLAHLMRPLRIRTFLTTNFDNLLEQAIKNIKTPVSVFDVRLNGSLPDSSLVKMENAIIKLHGSTIDTRADFSLDETPSRDELDTFYNYFSSEKPGSGCVPSQLLVMGFSGRDKRIIQVFRHLLQSSNELVIYWVAYSKTERQLLRNLFSEEHQQRVFTIFSTRQDLFLYELYQRLTLSLPPGGLSYELSQYVPPFYKNPEGVHDVEKLSPDRSFIKEKASLEKLRDYIVSPNDNDVTLPAGCKRYPFQGDFDVSQEKGICLALDSSSGVALPMKKLFHEITAKGLSAIWLELEDFISPHALASKILQVITLESGIGRNEHFGLDIETGQKLSEPFRKFVENYTDTLKIAVENWVIFLYGRNGPGGCSGWQNTYWAQSSYDELESLLRSLASLGFRIVYMPLSDVRFKRNEDKERFVTEQVNAVDQKTRPSDTSDRSDKDLALFKSVAGMPNLNQQDLTGISSYYKCSLPESVVDNRFTNGHQPTKFKSQFRTIFNKALSSTFLSEPNKLKVGVTGQIDPHKLRFLYASTLFRQSRHPSSLISEAVFPCPYKFNTEAIDNDFERSELTRKWFSQLEGDVFFKKPGGYAWMYRDVRLGVRHFLETVSHKAFIQEESGKNKMDYLFQRRARTHFWIGEWYLRVFHSVKHIGPLIESIYHRIACINFSRFAKPSNLQYDAKVNGKMIETPANAGAIYVYRFHLLHSAITELIKTLRQSRQTIESAGHGSQLKEVFMVDSLLEALGLYEHNHSKQSPIPNKSETYHIHKWMLKKVGIENHELSLPKAGQYVLSIASGQNKSATTTEDHSISLDASGFFADGSRFTNSIASLISLLEFEIIQLNRNLIVKSGSPSTKFPPDRIFKFTSPDLSKLEGQDYRYDPCVFLEPYQSWEETRKKFTKSLEKVFQANIDLYELQNDRASYEDNLSVQIKKFLDLTSEVSSKHNSKNNTALRSELVSLKQKWVIQLADNYMAIHALSMALNEYAYALVRRAKLEPRLDDVPKALTLANISQPQSARVLWVGVCGVCWMGQDLLKNLHPDYREQEMSLRFKFLTYYGLALANLGRFYEAQRRFNEATAFTAYSSDYDDNVNLSILRLRRSEAHILTAKKIDKYIAVIPKLKNFNPEKTISSVMKSEEIPYWMRNYRDLACSDALVALKRLYAVKVDDAVTCIDSAEHLLSEYDTSSHWWGHLHLLKLIVAQHGVEKFGYKPILFNKRRVPIQFITQSFNKGILISNNDPFRKLRLVDEFVRAVSKSVEDKSQIKNIIENLLQRHFNFSSSTLETLQSDTFAIALGFHKTRLKNKNPLYWKKNTSLRKYIRLVIKNIKTITKDDQIQNRIGIQ